MILDCTPKLSGGLHLSLSLSLSMSTSNCGSWNFDQPSTMAGEVGSQHPVSFHRKRNLPYGSAG